MDKSAVALRTWTITVLTGTPATSINGEDGLFQCRLKETLHIRRISTVSLFLLLLLLLLLCNHPLPTLMSAPYILLTGVISVLFLPDEGDHSIIKTLQYNILNFEQCSPNIELVLIFHLGLQIHSSPSLKQDLYNLFMPFLTGIKEWKGFILVCTG